MSSSQLSTIYPLSTLNLLQHCLIWQQLPCRFSFSCNRLAGYRVVFVHSVWGLQANAWYSCHTWHLDTHHSEDCCGNQLTKSWWLHNSSVMTWMDYDASRRQCSPMWGVAHHLDQITALRHLEPREVEVLWFLVGWCFYSTDICKRQAIPISQADKLAGQIAYLHANDSFSLVDQAFSVWGKF